MTPPVFRLDGAAYEAAPLLEIDHFFKLMGVLIDNIKVSAILQIEKYNQFCWP